jgi:hypothetical protein
MPRSYPNPADPVSALTRPNATTEPHSYDHGRVIGIAENVKAWGAKGDNSTDDSAAIQACIDSAVGEIFFPPGTYRIGTPLVPRSGQTYTGVGSATGYSVTTSMLKCTGSNTHIWELLTSQSRCTWRGLVFQDKTAATNGTDTAFYSNTGVFTSSAFYHCAFAGLAYDFDFTGSSGYLIIWQWYTKTNGPSRFTGTSYFNDNHWIGCTWNGVRNNVPAIVIDGTSNPANGNWWQNCYFESCDRQVIKMIQGDGGVSSSYFEAINEDAQTYMDVNSNTHSLPAIDIQKNSSFRLIDNFYIGASGASYPEYMLFGNTSSSASDAAARLTLVGRVFDNTDDPTLGEKWYDTSNIRVVDMPGTLFNSTRGDATSLATSRTWPQIASGHWSAGTYTPDALSGEWFEIYRGDGTSASFVTATPTIANPTNATRGRRITFEFTTESGYTFTSVTWGSAFRTEGTFTPPTSTSQRKHISFYYNGQVWIETHRTTTAMTAP